MIYFKFLYYLLINILGFNMLPIVVRYNNIIWFNALAKDNNGDYHLCYSKFVNNTETEDIFEVVDKSEYKVFMKMLKVLWKHRKNLNFKIDIF